MVVCAYTMRRWDVLMRALSGVVDQARPGDQVLLVVDHNPELLRAAHEHAPKTVDVVENRGQQGLSGARNTGVAMARHEVVVFLDDDAVPEAGWLEAMLLPYSDQDVIGVGGVARPQWLSQRPSWFPEEFLWVVGCTYRGIEPSLHEVRNPIGANMSFRADVLARAGGFSEDLGRVGTLPLGCEETELSIKAAQAVPGGRIFHTPRSAVRHMVPEDRGRWAYFVSRCWSEGLSKAAVSAMHGRASALASERTYVARTLPAGVWTGIRQAVRGDAAGAGRACAIIAGLTITSLGYLRGRIRVGVRQG